MKKLISFVIALVLTMTNMVPTFAVESDHTIKYAEGLAYLEANNFDSHLIELMSMDEICEYATAQSTQSETLYYAFIQDKDAKNVEMKAYTQYEYDALINDVQVMENNTKTLDWIRLTILSTYQGGDNYHIACLYWWMTEPFFRWEDVVALMFDNRIIPQSGTGNAHMSYTRSDGSFTTVDCTAGIQYVGTAAYAVFDIPGWGNTDIFGALTMKAKINSVSGGPVSFNNWAYYAHMISPVSFGFSVAFPAELTFSISPQEKFEVADVGLYSTYIP